MKEKHRKTFYVEDDILSYIMKIKNEKKLPSMSASFAVIVSEHQQGATLGITEEIKDDIAGKVAQQQNEILRKILLATNQTNKVADINTILLNQYFFYKWKLDSSTENDSKQLAFAKEAVNRKIAVARTKSLD